MRGPRLDLHGGVFAPPLRVALLQGDDGGRDRGVRAWSTAEHCGAADWEATEDDGYAFVGVKSTESGLEQEYVQLSGKSLEQCFKTIMETRRLLDDYVMAVEQEAQKRLEATEFAQPLVPRS